MKLRNKKTGEVIESACIGVFKHKSSGDCERVDTEARSLEKVLEVWEDYTPAEPLIKDEKIRKAVRAWWKTIPDAITDKRVLYKKNQDLVVGVYTIYCGAIYPEILEVGKMYTIAELCGEEE